MKNVFLLIICLITCISCTKEDIPFNIHGTWAMVEREKGKADILGVEFVFSPSGQMTFGGRSGFQFELSEDTKTILYWSQKDLPFKHRIPIVSSDDTYMGLDMDSLDGGMGLGIWGLVTVKKIK